jgi:hypothetical protein
MAREKSAERAMPTAGLKPLSTFNSIVDHPHNWPWRKRIITDALSIL